MAAGTVARDGGSGGTGPGGLMEGAALVNQVHAPLAGHPSPEVGKAFLAGSLSNRDGAAFEEHLDRCPECRRALSAMVQARRGVDPAVAPTHVLNATRGLPAEPGQVIDGRFRIERIIGVGGMGCVFLAHHLHLNQPVALKFMLPELAHDTGAVARFMREARAAVRLRTEHIGRVLDLGTGPTGTPYLVMEFLTGETVEQRLHREGPYPPALAVNIIRQAISAVAEAHSLGIVHRDLKPANLFLARQPSGAEVVKVLDFGIAKSIHPDIEAGLEVSSQRMVVGSPHYMAPEQLSPGAVVNEAVDVWGLGCTLYQLVCGQLPFVDPEGSLVNLMFAIQNTSHCSLAERAPQVGRALAATIDRCLAKKPADRPSLAQLDAALARAFESTLESLPAQEPILPVAPPRLRSPRLVLAAGSALALALASVAALLAWSRSGQEPEPSSPAPPAAAALPSPPVDVAPNPSVVPASPHPTAPADPREANSLAQPMPAASLGAKRGGVEPVPTSAQRRRHPGDQGAARLDQRR